MTKINIDVPYPKVKPEGVYVYIHYKLSDGKPFYVGKGSWDRAWEKSKSSRSQWWIRTAIKHGVKLEICQEGLSDYDASTLEMWLIAKLRHEGCNLVNLTDGGEGRYGSVMTDKTKESLIASLKKEVWCSNGMHFDSYKSAALWLNSIGVISAKGSNIGECVRGNIGSAYGYMWSSSPCLGVEFETRSQKISNRNKKRVERSDGNVYNSVADAVRHLNDTTHPNAQFGNICECARKERGFAYGYKWRYV